MLSKIAQSDSRFIAMADWMANSPFNPAKK
jgi:hypothetical protein